MLGVTELSRKEPGRMRQRAQRRAGWWQDSTFTYTFEGVTLDTFQGEPLRASL